MAEQLDLSVASGPTTNVWKIQTLTFDQGLTAPAGVFVSDPTRSVIRVVLVGLNGRTLTHQWEGAAADTLINTYNKATFVLLSLQKTILTKLIADGVLSGTISGLPD